MFESLFGTEMPLAMRFFIAFVFVLVLIGATAWLIRRFGADRLGSSGGRGRQPRLAVIDAAPVDSRRRLVLIRRDNVEHLLMIGGPTDVVVEANIVRAAAGQRDIPAARVPAATDTLPRPVPLPEGTMWPLQPEPAPARSPRAVEDAVAWTSQPEPAPEIPPRRPEPAHRPPRSADSLAGLAAELSTRVAAPADLGMRAGPVAERMPGHERAPAPERPPMLERTPVAERPLPAERPPAPERAPVERAPAAERAPVMERPPAMDRPPAMEHAAPPPPPPEPISPAADQNLTEMAQRLEAALRRPMAADPRAERAARPVERAAAMSEPEVAELRAPGGERPAPAEGKARPKPLFDSLEQEMASLLGRPAGKP